MSIVTPDPTSVYRYYDRNNILLYVGITRRGATRNLEHVSKEWWQFVVRQEVEHLPHRLAATEREKHLIRKFRPPFNKQHNPFHAELRAIYAATASAAIEVVPGDARKLLTQLRHRLPLSIVNKDRCSVALACPPEYRALAEAARWDRPVLILAPKKVAQLVNIENAGGRTVYEFKGEGRIPPLHEPTMRLKARLTKPLIIGLHEVTIGASA